MGNGNMQDVHELTEAELALVAGGNKFRRNVAMVAGEGAITGGTVGAAIGLFAGPLDFVFASGGALAGALEGAIAGALGGGAMGAVQ